MGGWFVGDFGDFGKLKLIRFSHQFTLGWASSESSKLATLNATPPVLKFRAPTDSCRQGTRMEKIVWHHLQFHRLLIPMGRQLYTRKWQCKIKTVLLASLISQHWIRSHHLAGTGTSQPASFQSLGEEMFKSFFVEDLGKVVRKCRHSRPKTFEFAWYPGSKLGRT